MNSQYYDTIIIGAGLAGLATSLRLKKKGHRVLVVEKNEYVGGKLDELVWGNYRWDRGPSLFTDPSKVLELFKLFDKDPIDYFDYKELGESCRYFDGPNKFVLYKDLGQTIKQLEQFLSGKEIKKYTEYVEDVRNTNDKIGNIFIDNSKPKWFHLLSPSFFKLYPYFSQKKLRSSLDEHNERYFANTSLRKVFNRFGTYNGSDPRRMSGIYSLISNLELNDGSYFPVNGMRSIIESLYTLAQEENVDFVLGEKPKTKKTSQGYSVTLSEKQFDSKNLVCAIDHLQFYQSVIDDKDLFDKYAKVEKSTSGLVFYWAMNENYPEFGTHNILFSEKYNFEFKELFDDRKLPEEPTIYIHISSKINAEDAPMGGENWFVMINTPANIQIDETSIKKCREVIIEKIEKTIAKNIRDHIIHEDFWSNNHIEELTGSLGGAIYGPASNELLSTFKRHGNKSKKYQNLYFAGGTVHPGGGIPLVLRSAKIASDLIK